MTKNTTKAKKAETTIEEYMVYAITPVKARQYIATHKEEYEAKGIKIYPYDEEKFNKDVNLIIVRATPNDFLTYGDVVKREYTKKCRELEQYKD